MQEVVHVVESWVSTRREMLRGLVGVPAALTMAPAMQHGADNLVPALKRLTVPIQGLDRRLDGLRIGQISDAHIGRFLGLDHLQRAVDLLVHSPPDVLVVTGDLVDKSSITQACLDMLAQVRAPYGRFFIMGNHENYAGREDVIEVAQRHEQVRFLRQQETFQDIQGVRVHISGLDYPPGRQPVEWAWRNAPLPHFVYHRLFPTMANDVQQVTAHAVEADFRLCLVHHPDFFDVIHPRGVELTLAGHTHGGQVAPLGTMFAQGAFKYSLGLYNVGGRHLYVSGGTGHWFPLRIGVPAEVAMITLHRV